MQANVSTRRLINLAVGTPPGSAHRGRRAACDFNVALQRMEIMEAGYREENKAALKAAADPWGEHGGVSGLAGGGDLPGLGVAKHAAMAASAFESAGIRRRVSQAKATATAGEEADGLADTTNQPPPPSVSSVANHMATLSIHDLVVLAKLKKRFNVRDDGGGGGHGASPGNHAGRRHLRAP